MKITFIGTGYVGLVSGTCLSDLGHDITCMDTDQSKIDKLRNNGELPIYEPGLKELVDKNVTASRLHFTTDLAETVPHSDAVFIAVGTPQSDSGEANLDYVYAAARDIAPHLNSYTVVVTKSTVPIGTNRKVAEIIKQANADADFDVASNPEFLREGAAIQDFSAPDRIIVGAESTRAQDMMEKIYAPQTKQGYQLMHVELETAEMIKYAANAFLATKVTFMNELAHLCEKTGADVTKVADGMGLDKRIGRAFLNAGPGYGGSCFPKDTNALAFQGQVFNAPLSIVEATIQANANTKLRMVEKIKMALGGEVKGKTIGVLGLAFKPGTDDMREAQSLTILPALHKAGAQVKVYDPEAMTVAKTLMPELTYCNNAEQTAHDADALVLLTEWDEFTLLDMVAIGESMQNKVLVDLRNMWPAEKMQGMGFAYTGLGRANTADATIAGQEKVA